MLYGIHMSSPISVLYSLSAYNSDFHPFSIQFQSVHTFQLLLISSNVCCLKETCTKRARNTNTNIENEKKTKLIIICFIVHIYDFIIFVCLVKHLSPSTRLKHLYIAKEIEICVPKVVMNSVLCEMRSKFSFISG